MSEAEFNAWDVAHQDFHLALLSGATRIWLTRFAQQSHEQVGRHQRAIVLAQGVLPDARADEALSAILSSTSSIEHHTILMDTALDRDETRALGLLREHIGLPSDSRARAGADAGPTDGSMRDDARVRAR
jgi:GntR family carbon starvation induced transcriptional regulator